MSVYLFQWTGVFIVSKLVGAPNQSPSGTSTLFLPPLKLTYPLKIDGWKIKFPFKMVPFLEHVNFRGGSHYLV